MQSEVCHLGMVCICPRCHVSQVLPALSCSGWCHNWLLLHWRGKGVHGKTPFHSPRDNLRWWDRMGPRFPLEWVLASFGLSARGQHRGHTLMKSFWINGGKGSLVNRHTNKYRFNCFLRGGQHGALEFGSWFYHWRVVSLGSGQFFLSFSFLVCTSLLGPCWMRRCRWHFLF